MPILTLLRHAKAVDAADGIADHARALRPRGRRAATQVGFETAGSVPDLVLCSDSLRTRETLDLILAIWPRRPAIRYEPGLYLAEPGVLLRHLREVPPGSEAVWLIGHNPGLHQLSWHLSGGDPRLGAGLPTAARVVFELSGSWRDLGSAPSALVGVYRPADEA